MRNIFKKRTHTNKDIDPDEIFLDSSNLPKFDRHQFEGRIEKTLSKNPFLIVGGFFILVSLVFFGRAVNLQIINVGTLKSASENNRLEHSILFNDRGIIFDRNRNILAQDKSREKDEDFSRRLYRSAEGLAHVLGYVSYPAKDSSGYFYQNETLGKDGVEQFYNDILAGLPGMKIIEINASGDVESESVIRPSTDGENVILAIDYRVQNALFKFLKRLAGEVGFVGGAGVIMDIHTGELLALSSFPEYEPQILTDGEDRATIAQFVSNEDKPFLNRVVSGLYTPGSIIKPFIAIAALNERIITPSQKILSTGSISIPHPYIKDKESIFYDWKAHGLVDMKEALAYSSNVYFYEIGGGFPAQGEFTSGKEGQQGLGVGRIEQYMRLFGFGKEANIDIYGENTGIIPTPEWKEEMFNDEWRLGDTYNTAIGQYGFQITPLQAVRAIAALANGGTLLTPHLILEEESGKLLKTKSREIKIPEKHFKVVRDGLRDAVRYGTARGLNLPYISIAAKTGTAEIGTVKKYVNSWVIGFFPYEEPRFAFAIVMERGPRENTIGALYVMRELFQWMSVETPEYLTGNTP